LHVAFVPVIPVAVCDEAACHDDFLEFCGLAPIGLSFLAVVIGVPAAVIGTALSPRQRPKGETSYDSGRTVYERR
jgi:hypothetical protein